jgi:hypothetical protein
MRLSNPLKYLLKTALATGDFGVTVSYPIAPEVTSLCVPFDGVRENVGSVQVSGQCRYRYVNSVLKTGFVKLV